MSLLPGWERLLAEAEDRIERRLPVTRLDLPRASSEVRAVASPAEAEALVRDLRSTPLSAIAVELRMPLAVALAAWATDGTVFSCVLDVQVQDVRKALEQVLSIPVPLVVHDAKPLLLAVWDLGLDPLIHQLFDTRVAAACLTLGSHHPRARRRPDGEGVGEGIRAEEELSAERDRLLSLEGQCAHRGISLPIPPKATGAIRGVEARTLAARAIWALHLYMAQQEEILRQGLHTHLHAIEFPFAIANARMEHRGVHVAPERYEKLRLGCKRAADYYGEELRRHGIDPPGSANALLREMRRLRIEIASVDDAHLERIEGLHPTIRAFRLHRRYQQVASQIWIRDEHDRVHPEHVQLAAATGRNSCRTPNVAGIGRLLRPVVTAPEGRGLVELDYSQIEVGVAAAEHRNHQLVEAYNAGDVYAVAAQGFFADELNDEERKMEPREFRQLRPDLREAMKPFVLGVLYGGGARTVASQFGISETEAARRIERFLGLFSGLALSLAEHEAFGLLRGHAEIISGLRRPVIPNAPEGWTRNSLRNTPIQGGATVVFKKAVIDLDRTFHHSDTWLILPLHDGILIECPRDQIDEVAQTSKMIMEQALSAYYPVLRPRVVVNQAHPECWNKDGHADSLERFLADPAFQLDGRVQGARRA